MRAMLPHTEGTIDRDGVKLHYEICGDGDHTIIFVPTWAIIHSRTYKAQVPYFSEHFRVITMDPRGNGKSDRPAALEAYAFEHLIDDVRALMDATETEKAILFGFSLSSAVSFAAAARMPDRIDAVISIAAWTPIAASLDLPLMSPNEAADVDSHYDFEYWRKDYQGFHHWFFDRLHSEPHSTKQKQDAVSWASEGEPEMLIATQEARSRFGEPVDADTYKSVTCPVLLIHGTGDQITPWQGSELIAKITGGTLHLIPDAGHAPHGRFPAKINILVRDFLAEHLQTPKPVRRKPNGMRRVLYLSSPIGLGHARRDLAVARELRKHHMDLQVDWLAQDPVTRFLKANNETVHAASKLLANESAHIEDECGEHDLHAFEAIRRMDEILIKNFMIFQEVLEAQKYDLVIADEAWDVDHYWHEHPNLKQAPVAWMTDFVGWVPFEHNGPSEAFLTTDYNTEMINHVERNPMVRDRAIFVGGPEDIVDIGFGKDLPQMRDWIPKHYEFSDYIIGQHPSEFGSRDDLRTEFGYDDGRLTCIVSVGGSGVGATLIKRILSAYPMVKARLPDLRIIVVTGPRLDPASFEVPAGVEMRSFVPNLDRHLAACDLALVQGGLTTCMELAAAGTPFLYFPLRNHFEQNFHVASRLDRYNAGRKMIYAQSTPDRIADAMVEELRAPRVPHPVAQGGATKAARMLSELL
ncbi:MAG: alpha/beta fold hydrolase [Rhizobiaceae bacterium]